MLFRNWLRKFTSLRTRRALAHRRRGGRTQPGQSLAMQNEFVVSAVAERLEDRALLSVTTQQIDINSSGSSDPSSLTNVNGTLFFQANDGISGNELWKSDGTTTTRVSDIYSGSSDPRFLTNVNGTLFFRANDGISGVELWHVQPASSSPPANTPPTVANAIPDQNVTEDAAFSFQFADNAFADVDVEDTLTYSTGTRPAWLSFDAETRTFSGTPANGDVGSFDVTVTATDGSSATASDTFQITVANTNDAPTVANAIPDQNATEDSAFSFQFAADAFADVDVGDSLTYSISTLPAWLSFDAPTRTFSGTPTNGDIGTVTITARPPTAATPPPRTRSTSS